MKTRLIIGFGYVGARAGSAWATGGDTVFATTRGGREAELLATGARPIRFDVTRGGDELPGVATTLYAVGMDRSAGHAMRDVYVDGLVRTLERLPTPERFVYVSSTGVYGDHAGGWVTERTTPEPVDEGGRCCLEAERVLAEHARRTGMRTVILRFAGIHGPGRTILAGDLAAGRPIRSDPDGWLNLIHVADGVRAIQAAADLPDDRFTNERDASDSEPLGADPVVIVNVADGRPELRRDLYARLAERLGAPPPTFDPSAATRHRGNRRVGITRLRTLLGIEPRFLGADSGLETSDGHFAKPSAPC
jgi:nucleoside-diphosphate-sugar epimerase